MNGEHFAFMLLPGLYGEVVKSDVEELNAAVAGCDDRLILVRFRPGDVKERVLSVVPMKPQQSN